MLQGELSWLLLPRCLPMGWFLSSTSLAFLCIQRLWAEVSHVLSISSSEVKDGLPGFVSHD